MVKNSKSGFGNRLKRFFSNVNPKPALIKLKTFSRRWPFASVIGALVILFLLIAVSNLLTPKKEVEQKPEIVKSVQIYKLGQSPKVNLQAKVEKSGVIKISAISPGIVQAINVTEGQVVNKGQVLVNMSSNYQGGNSASLSRQLSALQYQNVKDTESLQREAIRLQKEIAHKTDTNSDEMRDITNKSIQETKDLISLNESIVGTLSVSETTLRNNNTGGINDTQILQLQSQRSQSLAGLNQLRTALRSSEYSASSDKSAAQLSDIGKDLALKQLETQEKALEMSLKTSSIQLQIAQVQEATMYPAAPFSAEVQRINVRVGQSINPGTVLMTLSAVDDPISAVVNLPQNLANSVSKIENSKLFFNNKTVELKPNFVSSDATEGNLYSVLYIIPDTYLKDLTDGEFINVEIPVGLTNVSSAIPFIPLDAVYQSTTEAFVFVVKGEKAESQKVELGNVYGRFVEVKTGLLENDQVIINRNVLAGDKIKVSE